MSALETEAFGPLVPDDGQHVERFLRLPPGVGDDCDGGVTHLHHVPHPGHRGNFGLVIARDLAAEDGTILDGGVEHAGQLHVDGVDLAAVELVGGVEPFHRLAGNLPILRILELDLLRIGGLQLGSRSRDFAVGRDALAGGVRDDALLDGEVGDRNFPLVGGRLQQHRARGGAALADILVRAADAAAAASRHVAPHAVAREILSRRGILGRDLAPVALELLDDELSESGQRALAHLRARDANDHSIVRLDDDPGIHLGRGGCLLCDGIGQARWQVKSECETATGGGRADQELAATEADGFRHSAPPYAFLPSTAALLLPAARWIAARMRA